MAVLFGQQVSRDQLSPVPKGLPIWSYLRCSSLLNVEMPARVLLGTRDPQAKNEAAEEQVVRLFGIGSRTLGREGALPPPTPRLWPHSTPVVRRGSSPAQVRHPKVSNHCCVSGPFQVIGLLAIVASHRLGSLS